MLDPRPFQNYGLLVRMHDWLTDPVPEDLSSAPKLSDYTIAVDGMGLLRLVAQVCGHPRLGDSWITTSPIWQIDPQGMFARTSSRWYRLSGGFRESIEANADPKTIAMAEQFLSTTDAIAHLGYIRSIVDRELRRRAN
ncbi:hypothetical protein MWU52_05380 [Jannaschia sp. S6380]|uniref:DUF6634 family protein n=1 Tax=Jannaschia sp. S6380 TaxID=2926408 RepID=UPI001FF2C91F|nr:DUF6634 family protein [Jannaschia sp. S6380]MCK0166978.1 hypothetical protein [Jannaschia sp. S6380]